MEILHIVEDFSVKSGGLRTVVKNIDFYLKSLGYGSHILSSNKEKEDEIFIVETGNKWLFSKEWKERIKLIVTEKNINIIHIHGVWLYPQLIGAKFAVKNEIPFVLSIHGMFQPWLWKKGRLKKLLYFNLLSKKWFSHASVIHTITSNETNNISRFFKNKKFIEIPNLISLNENKKIADFTDKYILYIGRLNKTKGIDLLIKSFAKTNNSNFVLKIAGGYNKYKDELQALVDHHKITKRVEFLGIVKNNIKNDLIKNAWITVAPTFSDVIGMVNLEAASLKTPVITTYNTGLKEGWDAQGGKLINPNINELQIALESAINWTLDERIFKGEQLFNFVKKHYSWDLQLWKWEELYKNTLSR